MGGSRKHCIEPLSSFCRTQAECFCISFLLQVQTTGSLAPRGINIECRVTSSLDLNRQVVRSEACTVKIPELELEIPPSRERAELNTIEGFVLSFAENLKCAALYQTQIKETATAERLTQLVEKLREMAGGKQPFVFELYDPSGNSYIESLDLAAEKAEETNHKREDINTNSGTRAPEKDTGEEDGVEHMQTVRPSDNRITVRHFERTREQLHAMGYFEAQEEPGEPKTSRPAALFGALLARARVEA